MNKKIRETADNYEKMLFREALRTGFFEMQTARDKYRELCGDKGMQWNLVKRFIRWQAIALSPICPHVAEHIWQLISPSEENVSILRQRWPEAGNVEEIYIKSSEYLMEAAREFRLKLKAATAPPKAKKGQTAEPPKRPTHATIYVAKTYPPWQCSVLSTLKKMYEASQPSSVPDNKAISQEMKNIPDYDKWKKKIMPFVAFT